MVDWGRFNKYRMASMITKRKMTRLLEEEIDALVVAEAGVESAWSKPVTVQEKAGNDSWNTGRRKVRKGE